MRQAIHTKIHNKTACNNNLVFKKYSNILEKITCKRCKKNLRTYRILLQNRYLSNKKVANILNVTDNNIRRLKLKYNIFTYNRVPNFKKEIWKIYRTDTVAVLVSNHGRFKNLKTNRLYKLSYRKKYGKRLYIYSKKWMEASGIIFKTFIDSKFNGAIHFKDGNYTNLRVNNLSTKRSKKQVHKHFINFIEQLKIDALNWITTYPKENFQSRKHFADTLGVPEFKLRNRAIAIKKYLNIPTYSKFSFYELCIKLLGQDEFPSQHMKL